MLNYLIAELKIRLKLLWRGILFCLCRSDRYDFVGSSLSDNDDDGNFNPNYQVSKCYECIGNLFTMHRLQTT